MNPKLVLAASLAAGGLLVSSATVGTVAPRQMERLGRGLVAIRQNDGRVYVGWRLLGTDPEDIAFNLYRVTA